LREEPPDATGGAGEMASETIWKSAVCEKSGWGYDLEIGSEKNQKSEKKCPQTMTLAEADGFE
jgi:hypothetical protein